MSRDYGELEKAFISELAARTGRDLDGWMAAIRDAAPGDKNDIIDWLRPQGFTFAHASWLERIHNNGGQPIYPSSLASEVDRSQPAYRAPIGQPAPATEPATETPSPERPYVEQPNAEIALQPAHNDNSTAAAAPARVPAVSSQFRPLQSADPTEIEGVTAQGKAYKPLAQMIIRHIQNSHPDVVLACSSGLILFAKPAVFAALLVSPKGLKLGIAAVPSTAKLAGLMAKRMPGIGPEITHMIDLTDARQVDDALAALVRASDQIVNSGDDS